MEDISQKSDTHLSRKVVEEEDEILVFKFNYRKLILQTKVIKRTRSANNASVSCNI